MRSVDCLAGGGERAHDGKGSGDGSKVLKAPKDVSSNLTAARLRTAWPCSRLLSITMPRHYHIHLAGHISQRRWSLNQRLAPLRRLSSPSSSKKRFKTRGSSSFSKRRSTRTSQTESGKAANDAASWEADWHSAKVGETGLTGNTDDLVK